MKVAQKILQNLLLLFATTLLTWSCRFTDSKVGKDYYDVNEYNQYYNSNYYRPYVVPNYPQTVPAQGSLYYSNPYALPSDGYHSYDSDYYYAPPNYVNPYDEEQRSKDLERSAGAADDKQ